MWGNVDQEIGATREHQLAAEFVEPTLDKGAQLRRHCDTTEPARPLGPNTLRRLTAAFQSVRGTSTTRSHLFRLPKARLWTNSANNLVPPLQRPYSFSRHHPDPSPMFYPGNPPASPGPARRIEDID